MSIKGKIEAIIYAAEEPVSLDQIATLLKQDVLAELEAAAKAAEAAQASEPPTADELEPAGPSMPAVEEGGTTAGPGPALPEPVDETGTETHAAPSVEASEETVPPESQPAAATASEEPSAEHATPERTPEAGEASKRAEAGDTDAIAEQAQDVQAEPSAEADPTTTPEAAPETVPDAASESGKDASVKAVSGGAPKRQKSDPDMPRVRDFVRKALEEMVAAYASPDRGIEIRQIAGGFRMATKPEHHDVVRAFAKSLKPPMKLSLQALETLAVVAYKQPITAPEVSEIRGVDSGGVLATLLDRKLVTTAGRKQVIGRPILYKTTKDFLLRFGLKDVSELPSMEEFEKMAQEQTDLFDKDAARKADASEQPSDSEIVSDADRALEDSYQSEPAQPPAEPVSRPDEGDYSDGADTAESVIREQVEGEHDDAEKLAAESGDESPAEGTDKNDEVSDPSPA